MISSFLDVLYKMSLTSEDFDIIKEHSKIAKLHNKFAFNKECNC